MPQKTKAEIAAEKAALKESNEVVKLENEFDRAMNEGKDPNPFDVKAKKRSKGGEQIMDENYRTKNKYKIQKGSKKRGRNIYHVSTEYLKDESKSKGGEPIKAVAGVLAGMAAGIAPGIIGLGYMANKRAKKKAKATAQAQAGMAESTIQPIRTLNRGGGMDMGHKPRPRGNPGVVETVVGKGGDYIKDLID